MGKPQAFSVVVVFESTTGDDDRLRRFVKNAVLTSTRNAEDALIAVRVYDEEGVPAGRLDNAEPTEEMKRMLLEEHPKAS